MKKWLASQALLAALVAAPAVAGTYTWNHVPAANSYSNSAGTLLNVTTSFNTNTNVLSWYATFGAVPNSSSLFTNGFTLALTDGPNPKGNDGELAILYFDARTATPILTAYGYNGKNDTTSYKDGSGASGTQTPDRIWSSLNDPTGALLDIKAVVNNDGTRTLGFTMDATLINEHAPLYPQNDVYSGIAYDSMIGYWFHPFAGLSTTYVGNFLSNWGWSRQGWLDGSNGRVIPEPASALLGMLGLVAVARVASSRTGRAE